MENLIEHTQNGELEAWVYRNAAGAVSVVCHAYGVETCRREYPARYTAEARAAANHYVLAGRCPSCPGGAVEDDFWPQYYAQRKAAGVKMKYAVYYVEEERPDVCLYVATVAPAWGLFLSTEDVQKADLRRSKEAAQALLEEAANLLPGTVFRIMQITQEGEITLEGGAA